MSDIQKVKDYYEQCDSSYQHWGEVEPYNLHYGYWDANTKTHLESLDNMNRVLAEKADIKAGDKILDAGCGVGGSSIWLAKHYDVEVVGITLSELQAKKATEFAAKAGVSDRVKFYVQDFNKTNFPDQTFDVVWGLESICYATDKSLFLKEAYRVLKDDGKIIIADGFSKARAIFLAKYFLKKWLFFWALPNLAVVENFKNFLSGVKFNNIKFFNINKEVARSAKEIYKRGLFGFIPYKVKNKSSVQIGHVKGCIAQYFALNLGAWVYGIFYAEK